MSRILDAVRRAEQERGTSARAQGSVMELLVSAQAAAARPPLRFPPIEYRSDSEQLRACGMDPGSQVAAERFRQLRYRLDNWRARQADGVLLVTSAIPGEGKTLVATNLAETLAQSSARVLLVDADMRRPGVAEALGLERLPGLAEILRGEVEWRDACREIQLLNHAYLPAGNGGAAAAELLANGRVKTLLEEAAQEFDWVIVDSAPLAPFADSLYLAAASRGVLLVARDQFTPSKVFQSVLESLSEFPLVGIVLNAVETGERDRYYYDYYRESHEPERSVKS
ncbi:MAG TPA: CpsD/CapB family tyrosine-protein kinase [Terriglobales bacterium]|nr:CpsD/CapB family tyrosine-protein kinase [Terriglobales bacterium]